MSRGFSLQYSDPTTAARAAIRLKEAGLENLEIFGPFPNEEIEEAMSHHHSMIPLIALIAGITGGLSAYALQYYTAVVQYPLNIGGRPLNSWPAFVPVTFELTVLFAACAIVLGFLIVTRLPQLHHPAFDIPGFESASDDKFYILVDESDFHRDEIFTASFIESLEAEVTYEMP